MRQGALIIEPSQPIATALKGYLTAGGYDVRWAHSVEEAESMLGRMGADIIFAGVTLELDGEAFCKAWKQNASPTPVALFYPPSASDADQRAQAAHADACLVGPLKAGTVVSCARMLMSIRELKQAVVSAESNAPPRPLIPAGPDELSFFQRLLGLELKRCRRYSYPVALVAVGLDVTHELKPEGVIAETFSQEARFQLSQCIRDTDSVVEADGGHFLVLLPYTSKEGSRGVAERLRSRLFGLHEAFVTASAGLVTLEPSAAAAHTEKQVLDLVVAALAKAQEAGGDRLEVTELGT